MILPTHMLVGGFAGALVSVFASVDPVMTVLAGIVAAPFPDLDMFLEHRKTLHRPMEYALLTLALLGVTAFVPSLPLVLLTAASVSLALHAWMEVFTMGQGIREGAMDTEHAVYDHLHHRWLPARELVSTGGAMDVLIGLVAGLLTVSLVAGAAAVVLPVMVAAVVSGVIRGRFVETIPDRFTTLSGFLKYEASTRVQRVWSRDRG